MAATAATDIGKLLDIDRNNGKPVIRGSRLRVETLVNGYPPEEIAGAYPNLTLSAVYAALSYYYEHKQEMDELREREIAEALAWAKEHGAEIV